MDNFGQINKSNKISLIDELRKETAGYSLECVELAASQMQLTKAQATAIFTAKGLSGTQLETAVNTALHSTAQKENAATTNTLSLAYKGLATSLGLTVTQLNIFLGIAVAAGAALYALHEYSQRMDRLSEAAAESIEEYNKLDSEIEDVNDELKTTHKRIEELEKQDNLTFVEQEELERLRSTNDELERSLPLLKARKQSQ